MTKYDTIKSLLGGAALVAVLSSTAIAQDAPVLHGNYAANIERANPATGPATPAANAIISTNTYGFAWPAQDERPLGNYSANVTLFDLHGR